MIATDFARMTLDQKIFIDHALVLVRWNGQITLGDISKAYEAFTTLPGAGSVHRSLHDLRAVQGLSLFQNGLEMLGNVLREDYESLPRSRRSAFVIDDRRYLTDVLNCVTQMNRIPRLHAKVFENMAEAIEWLDLPVDIARQLGLPD